MKRKSIILTLCMLLLTSLLAGCGEDGKLSEEKFEVLKEKVEQSIGAGTLETTEPGVVIPKELVGKSGVEGVLRYSITEEGVCIRGVDDRSLTEVYIPKEILDCPVVEIATTAFHNCSDLKKVEIADGVKSIGRIAFKGCTSLEELIIPGSIEEIGGDALEDTPWLAEQKQNNDMVIAGCVVLDGTKCEGKVVLPDYITQISDRAFEKSVLTEIILPEGLRSIEGSAFSKCTNLTEITVPDSVTFIGTAAFRGCESLSKIDLPEHITNIKGQAFRGTPWLESKIQKSEDGYVIINTTLQEASRIQGNAVIPEGVTSIDYAFQENENITGITVPGTVKELGNGCFIQCTSLETVTIMDGVEEIGSVAFMGCTALQKVIIPDSINSIDKSAFRRCTVENIIIDCSAGHTLLSSLKDAGFKEFEFDYAMENEVTKPTPAGVIAGKSDDFRWSENSTGVTIFSFSNKKATSVVIPEELGGKKVTEIYGDVFGGCEQLETVYIPSTVIKISGNNGDADGDISIGLETCKALKEIIVSEDNEIFASKDGCLYSKDMTCLFAVPCTFSGTFHVEENVTKIANFALENCSKITEIVFHSNEIDVGFRCFFGCSSLERFSMEATDGEYRVIDGALVKSSDGNNRLISVPAKGYGKIYEIPSEINLIDTEAFDNCVEFEKIIISTKTDIIRVMGMEGLVTYESPFNACTSLKEIEVASDSKELKVVDGVLFSKDGTVLICMPCASSCKEYIVPKGVTQIAHGAFVNCGNLKNITFSGTVEFIGESAFEDCLALTSVNTEEGLKIVGAYAFNNCENLKEVTLAEGVERIQSCAFRCCSKAVIRIPSSVTKIGSNAFMGKDIFSSSGVTIITPSGSYAEQYAIEKGISVQNQ